jgi:uncharacterized protein YprB with RNaseH-like and TPR domain
MENLSDKLSSLGVSLGTNHIKKVSPKSSARFGIDQVMDGQIFDTPFGDTYLITKTFSNYNHGIVPELFTPLSLDITRRWAKIDNEIALHDLVFLDTETTGLAGGTGTFAFMVGFGYFQGEDFIFQQLFMEDPGKEAALLTALEQLIGERQVVVTYNGKSFDIPLLNTRYVMNGLVSPFVNMAHIDLLHLARKLFQYRFESKTLIALEGGLLNVLRGEEEIPGWMAPQLYFDYLSTGDSRPLAGMFYHNELDIVTLAALLNYTNRLLVEPFGFDLANIEEVLAVAHVYEDLLEDEKAIQVYEETFSSGLNEQLRLIALKKCSLLYKRRAEWDKAIWCWKKGVEAADIEAYFELAKYFEHRIKDLSLALKFTIEAEKLLYTNNMSPIRRNHYSMDIIKRKSRLYQKLERESGRVENE